MPVTMSNDPSGQGSDSKSPWTNAPVGVRSRAISSSSGEASMPATSAPCRLRSAEETGAAAGVQQPRLGPDRHPGHDRLVEAAELTLLELGPVLGCLPQSSRWTAALLVSGWVAIVTTATIHDPRGTSRAAASQAYALGQTPDLNAATVDLQLPRGITARGKRANAVPLRRAARDAFTFASGPNSKRPHRYLRERKVGGL